MDLEPRLLLAILEGLPEGVIAVSPTGRVLVCNPAARALTGFSSEALPPAQAAAALGLLLPDGNTPLPAERFPLERALAGERGDEVEVVARPPGREGGVHLGVTAHPVHDGSGQVCAGIIRLRETGERRRREEELRRANMFLDSIVENIPDMIFVKDATRLRFELINRAGEELIGRTREELLGRSDHDFFPREQAEHFTARDRETLAGRKVVDIPEEPIHTGHGTRWLHTKKIPLLDAAGRPRYLLGISEDITERKHVERELRAARDELELRVAERTEDLARANEELRQEIEERQRAEEALRRSEEQLRHAQKMEAVGRLAGGVAHDFNNMLTAIISYTAMLTDALRPDDPLQTELGQIARAADRAAALTQQLLAFSRRQMLRPKVLDLGVVVNDLDDMLRRLIGEDVELVTSVEPRLGCVHADPGQMAQVLMNLVVNARDAMPRGGRITIGLRNVALEVDCPSGMVPGRYVSLVVSDTGVGMDQQTISRIFEPFFTTKEVGKGTGLGLSTVYGIVKQSGGEITVESAPGRGSRFQVYLPVVEREAEATVTPVVPSAGRPATILLVEDEDLVRAATRDALRARGYTVLESRRGDEALRCCQEYGGSIDLVLSDVVMPGMDGRELVERLRTMRPGLRVLFMSGYTDVGERQHPPGAAGLLRKPFTPQMLVEKIRQVLEAPVDA
ncbi:MAG: PAS domain-containing protein [Myxococcota bacterium]